MGARARALLGRALGAAPWLLVACGARSPLGWDGPAAAAGVDAGADASAPEDARVDAPEAGATCRLDDLSTWRVERYRDQGDYERAAVAVSGVPWVALKVNGGNIILVSLAAQGGIVFQSRIEIPSSPVYPAALDVDDRRFVLLTASGINFNGDIELWRVDRVDGTVAHVPLGQPSDPSLTFASAIGLAGDDVAVVYGRGAANQGSVELRDDKLQLLQSLPVTADWFTAVRTSATAIDLYAGPTTRVHAESGTLTQPPVDPKWPVLGGLDGFLVEMGDQIRLTQGAQTWSAAWPASQISPPAVVRTNGPRAAFSLETELTAVVGHEGDAGLEWLTIQSAPGAPGFGAGLLPLIEPGRLGLFYLGLEMPRPEQPLRYFGLACP